MEASRSSRARAPTSPTGRFTTFYALEEGRSVVDCWSVRMASIRSAEIVAVWRRDEPADASPLRRPTAAA